MKTKEEIKEYLRNFKNNQLKFSEELETETVVGSPESYQTCINKAYSNIFEIYMATCSRFQVLSQELKRCEMPEQRSVLHERLDDLQCGIIFLSSHLEKIAALDKSQGFPGLWLG